MTADSGDNDLEEERAIGKVKEEDEYNKEEGIHFVVPQ
jgi:hypothetical protein